MNSCINRHKCSLRELVITLRSAAPDDREAQTRAQWFAMHDAALRRGDSWDSD